MFNKEFLKKLTILYVEDEDLAREKLAKSLKKMFKKVLLAPNGLDGFVQFQKSQIAKEPIDLIISDINMPQMNGIEMLENIRKLDENIPFIFTTARSESEHLLRAIELNVNHYILKPIDTQDLIMRVQVVCEKKYFEQMLKIKQQELNNYLKAIDNVAVVFKMKEDGSISFSNKSFQEISKYSQEELEELNFDKLIHPQIDRNYINKAWEDIKSDNIWSGNTKFIDKNKETYYINNTTFKIENDLEDEFITIGFLTTKENLQKREFQKKVLQSIQEFNKKEQSYKKLIEAQDNKIKELEFTLPNMKKQLDDSTSKSLAKNKQLKHYELQIEAMENKFKDILVHKKEEVDEHLDSIKTLRFEKEKLQEEKKKANEEIEALRKENQLLNELNERKEKRIENFEEIVKDLEEKLESK